MTWNQLQLVLLRELADADAGATASQAKERAAKSQSQAAADLLACEQHHRAALDDAVTHWIQTGHWPLMEPLLAQAIHARLREASDEVGWLQARLGALPRGLSRSRALELVLVDWWRHAGWYR
jgi:hypothetical protein